MGLRAAAMRIAWLHALCVATVCVACGCATRDLMPTPNLYVMQPAAAFRDVPDSQRRSDVVVPYATDRARTVREDGVVWYGHGRSTRLALGACRVEFGEGLTWEELVALSTTSVRRTHVPLRITEIEEYLSYPDTPFAANLMEDPEYTREEYDAEAANARDEIQEAVRTELLLHGQREVFLYIHGYNNSFDDAVLLTAQFWHFLGRRGIPVAYTWPAGRGGLVGYTTDSESGDFTVFHLKSFLRDIAAMEVIDKIHILSHSRGTDVLTAALRELKIEADAAGADPKEALKLGQVVMAAPDIDTQVFGQRFLAEDLPDAADGVTIYLSGRDRALLLSKWLHSSVTRLGMLPVNQVSPELGRLLGYFPNLHFINADVESNFIGHDFFYTNPAVSSDLILLLKEGRQPGAEHGRPLHHAMSNVWTIHPWYPRWGDYTDDPPAED